jgi:succinoglycan biosynthesis transport protein ExoP
MNSVHKSRAGYGQLKPLSLVRMLWNQKLMVVVGWLVLSSGAGYVVARLPNVYRAEALILVDSQKIPEKFVASTVQVSLQDSLNGISQQVLSVNRLHGIISEFNLYAKERKIKSPEEVIERMRKDLTVNLERGFSGSRSGAFRISYEGSNPSVVAGVVNRITDLFIRENLRTRERRAEGTSDFIDTQLKQAKASLDTQEATLSEYKVQWAGELPQQEAALLGALGRLQAELQGNQDAVNRAQQTKLLLENSLPFAEASVAAASRALTQAMPASVTVYPATGSSDTPRMLESRSSDKMRTQLRALRFRYYDDHPEVKRLTAELNQVLAEEAKMVERQTARQSEPDMNASTPAAVPDEKTAATSSRELADLNRERERVANVRTQIELANKEMLARYSDRQRILKSIGEYQARVEKLPIREQQMASLTRDYEISKMNYRSLLDKKISAEMATEMERSKQSEGFTVADSASVPTGPVKPKRAVYYAASSLGALMLSLCFGLAIELMKGTVQGEWELPSDIRVLGRISKIVPPVTAASLALMPTVAPWLNTGIQ